MNGAIIFSGQYGSTAQYADWISETTGLPVYDTKSADIDLAEFDFLILGSSVIIYKLTIRNWVKSNLSKLAGKPIILFTVSGAGAGPKLESWVKGSLPSSLMTSVQHVALRGRLDHSDLSWWLRLVLRVGAWKNDDPKTAKEELEGFDFVDKSSIEPILTLARQLQSSKPVHSQPKAATQAAFTETA